MAIEQRDRSDLRKEDEKERDLHFPFGPTWTSWTLAAGNSKVESISQGAEREETRGDAERRTRVGLGKGSSSELRRESSLLDGGERLGSVLGGVDSEDHGSQSLAMGAVGSEAWEDESETRQSRRGSARAKLVGGSPCLQ